MIMHTFGFHSNTSICSMAMSLSQIVTITGICKCVTSETPFTVIFRITGKNEMHNCSKYENNTFLVAMVTNIRQ